MMQTTEEQLYYACMNFCEAYFHMLSNKYKIEKTERLGYDMETHRRMIEFEEERFASAFHRLCEAIDKIKNEN